MGTGDMVSHGHPAAGRDAGGAEWEIAFYEDILKRSPDYVEVLMLLGGLYTGTKKYAKGLSVDQRLATLKKDDPIVQYNLACSHALLGQPTEAFEALKLAAALGYRDLDHMAKDRDLDCLRSDPRYQEVVAAIRNGAAT